MQRLLVRQKQAAASLGVTDRTLRNWQKSGLIKPQRIGGIVGYYMEDLHQLVANAAVPFKQPEDKRDYIGLVTYFVQAKGGGLIKIGRASWLKPRMRGMQANCPVPLELLGYIYGDREEELHAKFAAHRAHYEWFYPHPDLIALIETESNCNFASPKGGLDV